jgi:hypothetical protein
MTDAHLIDDEGPGAGLDFDEIRHLDRLKAGALPTLPAIDGQMDAAKPPHNQAETATTSPRLKLTRVNEGLDPKTATAEQCKEALRILFFNRDTGMHDILQHDALRFDVEGKIDVGGRIAVGLYSQINNPDGSAERGYGFYLGALSGNNPDGLDTLHSPRRVCFNSIADLVVAINGLAESMDRGCIQAHYRRDIAALQNAPATGVAL